MLVILTLRQWQSAEKAETRVSRSDGWVSPSFKDSECRSSNSMLVHIVVCGFSTLLLSC